MDRFMKFSIIVVTCSIFISTLSGCSSIDKLRQSETVVAAQSTAVQSPAKDDIKERINKERINDSIAGNKDLQNLRDQLAKQQQQLETMNSEQQALQEQLKRQYLNLQIVPTATANAGRTTVGTASTAYVAFLEDESQFADVEELFSKEISIIPNRESSVKLSIPQEARFIAIKVGLRYTKKRSQVLIPIESLNFDEPLAINIGACDINIKTGVDPKLSTDYASKLKYYQQPLVSCQ